MLISVQFQIVRDEGPNVAIRVGGILAQRSSDALVVAETLEFIVDSGDSFLS